jgi:hypothetical protein
VIAPALADVNAESRTPSGTPCAFVQKPSVGNQWPVARLLAQARGYHENIIVGTGVVAGCAARELAFIASDSGVPPIAIWIVRIIGGLQSPMQFRVQRTAWEGNEQVPLPLRTKMHPALRLISSRHLRLTAAAR